MVGASPRRVQSHIVIPAIRSRDACRLPPAGEPDRSPYPGLRALERYAVRVGGAHNHRDNLGSAVMIKDNHIVAAGGITTAIVRARKRAPHTSRIEVEVASLAEFDEAVAAGADVIMLDNHDVPRMREAVAFVAGRIPLEASGNVSLDTIRAYAETGVDYISVGGLTKDVRALDLSMRFRSR